MNRSKQRLHSDESASSQAIIISISSDIGLALAKRLVASGWNTAGTYRTMSADLKRLAKAGVKLFECDLRHSRQIERVGNEIGRRLAPWDLLAVCPGTLEPIGLFPEIDFDAWQESLTVNFINPVRFIHGLLTFRNTRAKHGPCVLLFAGGGSNSATTHYSAYTISKIALTKMCELWDAEVPDARFVIVGPGWVRTKIHEETLRAQQRAGANFNRTRQKFTDEDWVPMERVLDCCQWLIEMPREVVGGRNFSVVSDAWGSDRLTRKLITDRNMYKLRRARNDWT